MDLIMAKITGEKMENANFKRDVKDTIILAIASLILFMVAAAVETYITPYLLGM